MLELKEIGLRVASLRDTCGLSSAEMAEKLEISEDDYIAWPVEGLYEGVTTVTNIEDANWGEESIVTQQATIGSRLNNPENEIGSVSLSGGNADFLTSSDESPTPF